MHLVFFGFDMPIIKALSEAKVFQTKEEVLDYLKDENPDITDIDIASIGYSNKLICREEFREVWATYADKDPVLVGKVIQVEDVKRFVKSVKKWASGKEESYPEECANLKALLDSI